MSVLSNFYVVSFCNQTSQLRINDALMVAFPHSGECLPKRGIKGRLETGAHIHLMQHSQNALQKSSEFA